MTATHCAKHGERFKATDRQGRRLHSIMVDDDAEWCDGERTYALTGGVVVDEDARWRPAKGKRCDR